MSSDDLVTAERVRELMNYDPITGSLTWRVSFPSAPAGRIVGHRNQGYLRCKIDGRKYVVHRIVWLYVYGCFPSKMVDHINGIRDDNRITNLRSVDAAQNQWNRGVAKNNTSGIHGVIYRPRPPWCARITVHGKRIIIGWFNTREEAMVAFEKARAEFFGEFAPKIKRMAVG